MVLEAPVAALEKKHGIDVGVVEITSGARSRGERTSAVASFLAADPWRRRETSRGAGRWPDAGRRRPCYQRA